MKAPGAVILDAEGLRLSGAEKRFFAEADPWGFILFARNVDTPEQVAALCDEMRQAVGRDALITIDQEGGRVQRMGPPHWVQWTPPLDFVAAAREDAARALWLRYRLIAAELRAVGVDSNCAPTCDLARPDTHPFLRNRCLGSDPDQVARLGRAVAEGLLAGGVLPVMKHMPGHGRAVTDSHGAMPRIEADLVDLETTDFTPFRALNDLPLGMTGHMELTAIDRAPATTSATVIGLIRRRIGFDGLLMTDDITMQALPGTLPERAAAALAAGVDVVLCCNQSLEDRRAVAAAAGPLDAAGQARAARALEKRRMPETLDIDAARAELATLLTRSA